MLFISCIPYHDWTAYLYTDSIFGSLLIIFAYHFYYALKGKNKNILYAALLFLLLCFERPTGLLLMLPVYAVLLLKKFSEKKWIAAIFFLAVLPLFAWLINYAAKGA